MHRRSNKSAKVPNVKLRPAAPLARRSSPQSFRLHDSDDLTEQDVSHSDRCYRPFRSVVICATGINDKTSLFKQAVELGATPLNDLTDKVTHVLAEGPGSAKYKCALENKIPIMHPSWITDSHDIWLRGDEFDLEESILSHRLPVFSGVILCLSGIDDLERRGEIHRLVTQQGGTYVKQIERPVRITHLLCASGPGARTQTDKMRYAEKFNQRGEAHIRLVWEEWFWDSVHYGGRFEEELYKISEPAPQRRASPEPELPPSSSSPAASLQVDSIPQLPRPSTLKVLDHADLLAGDDEEEVMSVKRVPGITLQIWESILKPRGFEIQEGRLVRSPSKSQPREDQDKDQITPARPASPSQAKSARLINAVKTQAGIALSALPASALATFRREHSFAPVPLAARQPFSRVQTTGPSSSFLAHPVPDTGKEKETESAAAGLFAGLTFRTLGEARCASVRTALEDRGGRLVPDEGDEQADYVIVRLVSGSTLYREEVDEAKRAKYRTECWLEHCIFDERICGPGEHVAFTPLQTEVPISGADAVNLSFSGLDQSEACWIRRLIHALGANFTPNFSRRTTHLLCPLGTGAKADKAREWGVPIVSMAWLAEMVRAGVVPPVTEVSTVDNIAEVAPSPAPPAPELGVGVTDMEMEVPKVDCKGKGKERSVDRMMANINNGSPANTQPLPELGDSSLPAPQPHIEFEHTHQPSAVEQEEDQPFGQPGLLGPAPSLALSYATPPRSRVGTPDKADSAASPHSVGRRLSSVEPMSSSAAPPTQRVPSSESPSPIKLLPHTDGREVSPVKEKPSSKVLHESITTLLGKRRSEEEEGPGLAREPSRMGKRARPPSKQKLVFEQDAAPAESTGEPSPQGVFKGYAVADGDMSFLDGDEHSMRVTYEDPGQHGEKQRLMKLLTNQKQREFWDVDSELPVPVAGISGAKGAKKARGAAARRNVRVAGF